MVNKNRKADLVKFLFWAGGIIFGLIVFIAYGFYRIDDRYLKALDAKITDYLEQQWETQ